MTTPADPRLSGEIVRRLRDLHAMKAGALHLFDPMLRQVARAHERAEFAPVSDLPARMLSVFSAHREQTAQHAQRLSRCLAAYEARPSRPRVAGVAVGSALRARIGAIGGLDLAGAARDAFIFENLEVAQGQVVRQIAARAGDPATVDVLDAIIAEDREMAATIARNWPNIASFGLAVRGLPVLRDAEA